ncbi:MAG: thioredoxin family protein [Thermaerobacter sp.]|jgi:glutaredoxin|nr:thioredoxin family protein [Thermaerobacter sp.]MDA8146525.1 thioredoxin family protein [Thermaerobacter sp.]
MEVILAVSRWCPSCPAAEQVWRKLSHKEGFAFRTLDVGTPEGRRLSLEVGLKSVPTTLIDGRIVHVGVPTPAEARSLLQGERP